LTPFSDGKQGTYTLSTLSIPDRDYIRAVINLVDNFQCIDDFKAAVQVYLWGLPNGLRVFE